MKTISIFYPKAAMHSIRIFTPIVLLMVLTLLQRSSAAEDQHLTYSFEGVIASIAKADSKIVLKTRSDAKKALTQELKITDKTVVTIDKKPATLGDLVEGDKVWANFGDGIAIKVVVTRTP